MFSKKMQPILKLNIAYECVNKTLNGFIPVDGKTIEACNGYKRSSLNGLTVVFFKQLPTKSYHIVVCEIDEKELEKVGMKYEDLIRIDFKLTF